MGDYSKLKALAEGCRNEVIRSHGWAGMIEEAELLHRDERFLKVCSPEAVLDLIADNESLHKHWANESNNVQALTAEVMRLKAENETLVKSQGAEMFLTLTSEISALRKDADRLRWLRQYEFDIGSYHGVHEHNAAAWFEHISDEDIDSMIADEAQFAKEAGHE